MSGGSDSQSNSQFLSSSQTSLRNTKKASSELSKTYKHASQLYLTRRLAEAYELLQPVISPPAQVDGLHVDDDEPGVAPLAPIATATTSQRIKLWSLYITLLNAIVDLDSDEGHQDFGQKAFRTICNRVRSGDIWELVVRDGYRGREGSVDAEVVFNLTTLLLGQAPNQKPTESRLETYLSASSPSALDLSSANFDRPRSNPNRTDTPKDLTQRLRIVELFTLHVLPKNNEWDYARSFISNSDILDDERREALLQTLQELQDVNDSEEYQGDVFEDSSEELQTQQHESAQKEANATVNGAALQPSKPHGTHHKRTSSEVDYGIEKSHPNGTSAPASNGHAHGSTTKSPKSFLAKPSQPSSSARSPSRPTASSTLSPPSRTPHSKPVRKSQTSGQNDLVSQARHLFRAIQNLVSIITGTLTSNPTVVFRLVLFLLAFFMAFSRPEIRERVKRILGAGLGKVRQTVGMGVKVSYI